MAVRRFRNKAPRQWSFSIRVRVLLTIGLTLVVGLGAIGWSIDRLYANSVMNAIRERLTGTLNLLVASIEEQAGALRMDDPPDPRLRQPDSNLTAGMRSGGYTWLSPSTLQSVPGQWPACPRGVRQFDSVDDFLTDAGPQLVMSWQLGWETEAGAILPLSLWAAVDRAEYSLAVHQFRGGLWRWLAALGGVLLSLQLVIGWLGMIPLRRVEREIGAIERGEQERLAGRYPRELQPLTENLNRLLDSERAGQQQYRKALGNLAHAMKTPLAVLASILDQQHISDTDRRQARSAVQELDSVSRHQLERAATAARRTMAQPVPVAAQVERLQRSLQKLYPQTDFQRKIEPGCVFFGEQRDLLEILGNLMENACKYGGGKVLVAAAPQDGDRRRPGLRLSVGNSGAPVAEQQFRQWLRRGVRGDQHGDGAGFGLSIVADIADAYRARLYARQSRLGGLEVVLEFP